MQHEEGMNQGGPESGFPAAWLLESSPLPMAQLDGDNHVVRYANPAFCRMLGVTEGALTGRAFAEVMRESGACLAVLDRVHRTGEAETHSECKLPGSHAAYLSYTIWPALDERQHPGGLIVQVMETTLAQTRAGAMNEALLISSVHQHEQTELAQKLNNRLHAELAERKRVEDALQRASDFDRAIMTSMSEGLYTTDRDGRLVSMNPAAEALLGWPFTELSGRHMHEMAHHHHSDGKVFSVRECPLSQVVESGEPLTGQEDEFIRKDGSFLPVVYSAAPVREGDEIVGLVVIFRDATEKRRAEERGRALAKEISHRNKNLLTIVQTIVSRSLAEKTSPAEARRAIMQRLQAIAKSQTALETGGFVAASLDEITRLEFEPFSGRIDSAGPEVLLNPLAAQTFAMLLHELATNAVKYGALSAPNGKVSVQWSVEPGEEHAQFRFRWSERGGPPVTLPGREGFGSVLIDKIVAQDFGARAKTDFAPEGLNYEMEVALSALAPDT